MTPSWKARPSSRAPLGRVSPEVNHDGILLRKVGAGARAERCPILVPFEQGRGGRQHDLAQHVVTKPMHLGLPQHAVGGEASVDGSLGRSRDVQLGLDACDLGADQRPGRLAEGVHQPREGAPGEERVVVDRDAAQDVADGGVGRARALELGEGRGDGLADTALGEQRADDGLERRVGGARPLRPRCGGEEAHWYIQRRWVGRGACADVSKTWAGTKSAKVSLGWAALCQGWSRGRWTNGRQGSFVFA